MMRTVAIELPEPMAQELADADPDFITQILRAGLQHLDRLSEVTTEHPYITCVPGKRGGRPIIRGTGITVSLIASLYKAGDTVDDILESYPHLSASWVYDAIGYYLDHQDTIEREIRENRAEYLVKQHDLTVDERGFVHLDKPGQADG